MDEPVYGEWLDEWAYRDTPRGLLAEPLLPAPGSTAKARQLKVPPLKVRQPPAGTLASGPHSTPSLFRPDRFTAMPLAQRRAMPRLVEGDAVSGRLRPEAAAELGLPPGIPVAGGAGDNAAGAVGIGCVRPGQGFVSLGTSGVVFVCDAGPVPAPERAVHAFCHCLPRTWHRMSVILSAAGSLAWFAAVAGAPHRAVHP